MPEDFGKIIDDKPISRRKHLSADDIDLPARHIGVKAIDKDGNESLVTPYVQNPRQKRTIQTY